MMKHSKRFLCLLLTLILAASLCVFPAAAADQTCPSSKDDPVVFVHGLMGWGQRAGINAVLPYWGMTTGSLTSSAMRRTRPPSARSPAHGTARASSMPN